MKRPFAECQSGFRYHNGLGSSDWALEDWLNLDALGKDFWLVEAWERMENGGINGRNSNMAWIHWHMTIGQDIVNTAFMQLFGGKCDLR